MRRPDVYEGQLLRFISRFCHGYKVRDLPEISIPLLQYIHLCGYRSRSVNGITRPQPEVSREFNGSQSERFIKLVFLDPRPAKHPFNDVNLLRR